MVGHPQAVSVGQAVLAAGGNAVDAVVAGAFMAGVVALPSTGIGGYGGVAMIGGLPDGKVAAIDFNGTAPRAMRENQYQLMGPAGKQAHMTGWTSAGVPVCWRPAKAVVHVRHLATRAGGRTCYSSSSRWLCDL